VDRVKLGFHASHEQVHPSALLEAVQLAEEAGFDAAMCSDHLEPWSERQGQSAFTWSWLGAALQATRTSFGTVSAPGQRYHPVIIAQALATLGAMYPGRVWVALGSGEAINEHVTGDPWPPKEQREARLRECADVMRALLHGEEVSLEGLIRVDRARLWTLPEVPPPLYAAAVGPATAAWAAEWADGLVTVGTDPAGLREVVGAYRDAGGRGPVMLQMHVSYAGSEDAALRLAHDQWRGAAIGPPEAWDLDSVAAFDAATADVPVAEMRDKVLVAVDLPAVVDRIRTLGDLGFDTIYLHHVGKDQRPFIDAFAEHVLPAFHSQDPKENTR